jgi:hypothetical protein
MTENPTWYLYYKMDNNNNVIGSGNNNVPGQDTVCDFGSHPPEDTVDIKPTDTEFNRLGKLISEIYQLIPIDSQYQTSRNQLSKLNTSLLYTAPEIVSNYWSDLYQFLITYMPDTTASGSENIPWVKKIQKLWGIALQRENTIKRK